MASWKETGSDAECDSDSRIQAVGHGCEFESAPDSMQLKRQFLACHSGSFPELHHDGASV